MRPRRRSLTWTFVVALIVVATALPASAAPGDLLGGFGHVQCGGDDDDQAAAVAQRSDGSVFLAGTRGLNSGSDFPFLCMWTAAGAPDTRLDGDGSDTFTVPGSTQARMHDLVTDAKDRPVLVGEAVIGGQFVAFVTRLKANSGAFDTRFDADGTVILDDLPAGSNAYGVALDGKGRVVVVGTAGSGVADLRGFLVRLKGDGSRDTAFGPAGRRLFRPTAGGQGSYNALVITGGKIVVAGTNFATATFTFSVLRFTPKGTLDETFGKGGRKTVDLGTGDSTGAIAVASDGDLLITGDSDSRVAVVRLRSSGRLESGFGQNGKRVTVVAGGAFGTDILQVGTRILVSATTKVPNGEQGLILGYTNTGGTATGWGTDGVVTVDARSSYHALARRTGGGIWAAGSAQTTVPLETDVDMALDARATS